MPAVRLRRFLIPIGLVALGAVLVAGCGSNDTSPTALNLSISEQGKAASFTARLTFGAVSGAAASLIPLLEHAAEVELRWIGVETASGCPPTLASLFGTSNPWSSP